MSFADHADVTMIALPGKTERAVIDENTGGDRTIVAAPGVGKILRIHSIEFVCSAAVSIQTQSATTALSGARAFAANGGQMSAYHPTGWWETADNEAFVLNLSSGVQVSGSLTYTVHNVGDGR